MHVIIEAFCALEDICKAQKRANIPLVIPFDPTNRGVETLSEKMRCFAATFLMPAKAVSDTVKQLGIQKKRWSYELLLRNVDELTSISRRTDLGKLIRPRFLASNIALVFVRRLFYIV